MNEVKYKRAVRAARAIGWVCCNAAFSVVAFFGVHDGVAWAANVLKFSLWFMLGVAVLVALVSGAREEVPAKLKEEPPVPASICLGYDVAMSLFLAAHGWFGYAAIAVIAGMVQAGGYAEARRLADARATGEASAGDTVRGR